MVLAQQTDRRSETDHNGNYVGNYLPERHYVSSVLAFLDEFGIEIDVADISELPANEFREHFGKFFNRVNYARTRFALRQKRFEQGVAGTPLVLTPGTKEQLNDLIGTIRKIVNQEISDQRKKDAIFRKLRALQEEIDRDRHTFDSVFVLLVDVTDAIGRSADNLEPLLDKVERLKKIFFDGSKRDKALPNPDRKKQLPKPEKKDFKLDDEIPF